MSELTTLFKNTADAIRSKTGDTATMKASQFPAKIQGISVGISQDEADARYLQLSGGTMTGDLKVQESPASDKSAVSKSYAQGLFASALPKSGGTMTGNLILNGAPTADNQAATKAYVDGKGGGSVTLAEGTVTVGASNTAISFDVDISDILSHPNITLLLHCTGGNGVTVCYVLAQAEISSTSTTTALNFSVPSSGAVLSLPLATIPKGQSASTVAMSFVANGNSYYIYSGQLGTTKTRNNLYLKSNTGTFTAHYKIIMI